MRNSLFHGTYLGDRARELLAQAGASYADATGNLRQAVVDLISSPGRGPQEAEALVEKMKEPSMSGEHDPEYVAARRVLLHALEALGNHRKAVVLVGAQAIYLRVGPGDMAVAPFTTDGDLALNPNTLDDEPITRGPRGVVAGEGAFPRST